MLQEILALDPGRLSLLGIVLSALVASLGYYGKLRHERKKTRRVVLFYLLRLREATLWEDTTASHLPTVLVTAIEDALRHQDMPLTDDFKATLLRNATHSLSTFLSDRTHATIETQTLNLDRALAELAKDDPLLAARIAEGIPEPTATSERAERSNRTLAGAPSPVTAALIAALTSTARTTTLDRLTSTLRLTALECSIWSWISIELKLRLQSRWRPNGSLGRSVHDAVEELVQRLLADERRKQSELVSATGTQ